MSSILDALRRLEREQDEPSQATLSLAPDERPSRQRRVWLGAAAAVVAGGIAIVTMWGLHRGTLPDGADSRLALNQGQENGSISRRAADRRERRAKAADTSDSALRPGNEEPVARTSKRSKDEATGANTVRGNKAPPVPAGISRKHPEDKRLTRTRTGIKKRGAARELASRLHETRDRVHRDLARLRPVPAPEPRSPPKVDTPPAAARPAPAGITEGRLPMRDRLQATRRQAKLQARKNIIEIPGSPTPAGPTERGAETGTVSPGGGRKAEEHTTADTQESEEVMPRPPRGAPRVRVSFLFYSADASRRRVMLTIDGGKPTTLFEGQSAESLTIARILPDAVHLRYEGKLFAVRPR